MNRYTKQDGQVDYVLLKDLSQDEMRAKIRSGQIPVPPKGREREVFEAFASMKPEERDEWLKGQGNEPVDDNGPPAQVGDDKAPKSDTPSDVPTDEPKPDEKPVDKPDEKPGAKPDEEDGDGKPPKDDKRPWWEKKGYASEEEATEAFDSAMRTASSFKRTLDAKNSEDGKIGRENKELRDEVVALKAAAEKVKKEAPAVASATMPAMPELPEVSKFDDGALDDGYQTAMQEYHASMQKYHTDMAGWGTTMGQQVADLTDKVETVSTKAEQAASFTESQQQTNAQQAQSAAWEGVWKELRQAQKDYGLEFSGGRDVADINAMAPNPDLWKTLPAEDREKFAKLRSLASAMFTFGEQGPTGRRYKRVAAAIADDDNLSGMFHKSSAPSKDGLTPAEEKALREKKRADNDNSASPPPASRSAGTPDGSGADLDEDGAQARLVELNQMRDKSPLTFQKNDKLFAEFNLLRTRFGMKAMRRVPIRG